MDKNLTSELISELEIVLKETRGTLKAFRSGAGLRVVRVEKNDSLKAYGEHYSLYSAIEHLIDSYKNKLSYKEMYGENGKYNHYLTGSTDSMGYLDRHIFLGNDLKIFFKYNKFHVECSGCENDDISDEILSRVLSSGISETYRNKKRNITYKITRFELPNGTCGTSRSVIRNPNKVSAFDYKYTQTSISKNLTDAFINLQGAEKIEYLS